MQSDDGRADLVVDQTRNNVWYVRTKFDRSKTDNLLSLPRFS